MIHRYRGSITTHSTEAIRTARLILDDELREGRLTPSAALKAAVGLRRPSGIGPRRAAQRLAMKAGIRDGVDSMLGSALAVRRRALGALAPGPPRVLVRVDEFPYSTSFDDPDRYGVGMAERFHEIMSGAGVPYLLAVVPQLTHAPLDPGASGGRDLDERELALLERMRHSGVEFAQHGTTHRTRHSSPRKHSELIGLGDALGGVVDEGRDRLAALGISPRVFVPPFNRFAFEQWPTLAARYRVITGGPESVPLVGAVPSPIWWGDAVYLPCYPPLYADARTILQAMETVIALQPGCWVSIVLHTSWEADDGFSALERLVEVVAPFAVPWRAFLEAVDRSAGDDA